MERISKILVPTDFSDCSEEAVAYGVFLAKQVDATVLLVHILERMINSFPSAYTQPFGDSEQKIGQDLDEIACLWRREGVSIETHLLKGSPRTDIMKAAQNLECDLIVMGTHGRKGFAHALIGSVAEGVVRMSPIPVLTVRRREEASMAKEYHKSRETERLAAEES